MAVAIAVAAVMVMADADAYRADVNTDDGGIGGRRQKAKCKQRRKERFHGVNFLWGRRFK